MTIQQSLNQMLMSAQIGAGLYKQTPEAKKRTELKETKKALTRTLASRELQQEKDDPSEAAEKAYKENLALGESLTKKLFELEPTQENYSAVIAEGQGRQEYEDIIAAQLSRRQDTLKAQKEQTEMRRKLLEGTAEVPVKKTKVMEV